MAHEADPVQIVGFALEPVRARPYCREARDSRIIFRDAAFDPQAMGVRSGRKMIDDREARIRTLRRQDQLMASLRQTAHRRAIAIPNLGLDLEIVGLPEII